MYAEQTGSKHKNLQKRMKLAIGRSNNLKTMDSKRKDAHGNCKTVKADDIPHVDGKLSKRDNGIGKITMNSKTKDGISHRSDEQYGVVGGGGNRKFNAVSSDRKSKRIYADHGNKEERKFQNNVRTSNVKEFSKPGLNNFKDDFAKDKRSGAPRGRMVSENASLDKKGGTNLRVEMKAFHAGKDSELDCGGSSMLNKGFKIKTNSYKQFNRNPNNVVGSLGKSGRTKFQDKKGILDNAESTDHRPKKKKRVIRLDRHDFTNKRLDDGKATSDSFKDKKEKSGENEDVDMSKNAQFRAIQPSPSILSFVEKNLLGRRREIELRRAGYNTELSVPLDNTPLSTNSERERIEETVFRNKLTFFAAAKISSSIPPLDLPEIAFAGRSNVGKSSLLNSLTRQWGVVRTSDKPGLTQTINFFKLAPKLCLVDLPGYGFAYAKEEVKEAWEDLVKEYVSTRVGLKQVCLLIDTKWGMKPRDHELIDLMERSQTKYQVVLTKTDLVFPIDVARRAMQIEESLKAKKSAVQPVLMVSSKYGAGIRCLRTALAKIARFAKL